MPKQVIGISSVILNKEFDLGSRSESYSGIVYLVKNDATTKYKTLEGKKLGTLKKRIIYMAGYCVENGSVHYSRIMFEDGSVLEEQNFPDNKYYEVLVDTD